MCGYVLGTKARGEFEGDLFDEAASVDEDQGRAVILSVGGKLIEDLGPHIAAGDRVELVAWDLDGKVELATLADLDDSRRLTVFVDASEEVGNEFNGILRGEETDSLRRSNNTGKEVTWAEAVFARHEGV